MWASDGRETGGSRCDGLPRCGLVRYTELDARSDSGDRRWLDLRAEHGKQRGTIARDVGGLSEFIKNNQTGYLVSTDAADMAKVLLNLSRNRQQLKEVGISAHKLLAESFSVEVMAKKYNEIYKQLLISD